MTNNVRSTLSVGDIALHRGLQLVVMSKTIRIGGTKYNI